MGRIWLLLFLVALLASSASAAVPTFCKCTCFKNSTIIPLGPQHDNNNNPAPPPPASSSTPSDPSSTTLEPDTATPAAGRSSFPFLAAREASTSCKQCNRAFCLKYNLPFCKDAEEKDIVTSCFQRDSAKDQIIVWGFILGTAGLLGWAGLKRVVEKQRQRQQQPPRGLGGGGREEVIGGRGGNGNGDHDGRGGTRLWRRGGGLAGGRGEYFPLGRETDGGDIAAASRGAG